MSATSASPAPAPILSDAAGLEYKAFKRTFYQDSEDGVLCLLATCSFPTPGFAIFFQAAGVGSFKLMQTNPTGIEPQLVSYGLASWPASDVSALSDVPSHVTVEDAQGQHRVRVEHWK
jgi:hypothetical protein